ASLLVWNGVAAGVLYAHRVFWLPPATQLAGNVAIVLSILSLGRTLGAASLVLGVMISAVISAMLYLVKCIPLVRQAGALFPWKSEEHTSELQSRGHLVCRLLLEKKKKIQYNQNFIPASQCE